MRGLRIGSLAIAGVLSLAGCGAHDPDGPDVAAYGALARSIGAAAGAYGAAATATVDPVGCHSAHAAYGAQVRPMVERMRAMSGAMDDRMASMGGAADMGCGADAMAAEVGHHDAVACTSTSMPANHGESTRHAAAMGSWAAHQHARADQMGRMGGMMGGGGMMDPGSAPSTCRRGGDGTFTLGP